MNRGRKVLTTMAVLRKNAGLTQYELGEKIGLAQSQISLMEQRRYPINLREGEKLAKILGLKDPKDLQKDYWTFLAEQEAQSQKPLF